MFSKFAGGVAVAAALLSSPALAGTTGIDFDEAAAPSLFIAQVTLDAEYADLGVMFSGIGGPGAEILNMGAHFGIDARSGRNFLAFNTDFTSGEEQMDFAAPINAFDGYFSGGHNSSTFWAKAYNSAGDLIDSETLDVAAGVWGGLSLSGPGITRLQFGASNSSWVADDFSFVTSGVPEPATWAMMIVGFGAVGSIVRTSRRRNARAVA